MERLISDHMLVVYFTYGLAFFLLGIAILLQPMRGSAFKIGNSLWLLAGFGLTHGLGEWMDMFLTLGDTYWTPLGTEVIKIASFYLAAASFVCLLQFGLQIIFQTRSKYEFLKRTALIAFSVVSCGGDFRRRFNRFQRSMASTEPDPNALPARLSWSNFKPPLGFGSNGNCLTFKVSVPIM